MSEHDLYCLLVAILVAPQDHTEETIRDAFKIAQRIVDLVETGR